MPLLLATSIIFTANITGSQSSIRCIVRYKPLFRLDASSTLMIAFGLSFIIKEYAICSSIELSSDTDNE